MFGTDRPYRSARDDLPEEACVELVRHTGRQVEEQAPAEWRWLGHRVMDVDGSTITMPDMPANQAEYPQLSSQQRGCGFPIARIVVVFSLAVGTVIDAAMASAKASRRAKTVCSARCTRACRKETWCCRPLFQRLV